MKFELVSEFEPTGDQPQAIKELVEGITNNISDQTLLGVTGSGKTFTLVKQYLITLLKSDKKGGFKKLLALTFTNKAVGEMKDRVINTLKGRTSIMTNAMDGTKVVNIIERMYSSVNLQ